MVMLCCSQLTATGPAIPKIAVTHMGGIVCSVADVPTTVDPSSRFGVLTRFGLLTRFGVLTTVGGLMAQDLILVLLLFI